ncbi:MAG: hypothetical protein M1825_001666 [Sarcosagium campestre]|nr:MAG: hypothetical protein M1825_001666 [Sarcosagium campestre]
MATPQEQNLVSYEQLAELEKDFDDVDTEVLRIQIAKQIPLYKKRQELISKIDNFWPLVLEQAPTEIDQYIQPSDSELFSTALKSIDVSRFELEGADGSSTGNPRSVAIKFGFSSNDWLEDETLEKKFWFRRASDGWTGLVSEPVKIHWKKGKDLTGGLTDAVYAAWEAEKEASQAANGTKTGGELPAQKALLEKMESSFESSQSFFTWFGYRGRRVSAEESLAATKAEKERRERASSSSKGEATTADKQNEHDDDDEDAEAKFEEELKYEIFPDGEEVAVTISDDLFPAALKYFTQAQEDDAISDADFEESEDDEEEDEGSEKVDIRGLVNGRGGDDDSRPKKKRKA